jgi:hypothetical protein
MLQRALEGRVGQSGGRAELDFDGLHFDIRRQSLLVNGIASGREIAEIRKPEAALVRQLYQALACRAAEGVRPGLL